MSIPKEKVSPGVLLFLSLILFALLSAAGLIGAHYLEKELMDSLGEYVGGALRKDTGFKQIFLKAVSNDFRYTAIVLISGLSVYSSFLPLILTGSKGFCAGLAVSAAARFAGDTGSVASFSFAVFASCVFTVPVYVLMFILCFKFAKRNAGSTDTFGVRLRNYLEFFAAVTLLFAVLCVFDCLQAAIGCLLI